jgi:hypothetical protein
MDHKPSACRVGFLEYAKELASAFHLTILILEDSPLLMFKGVVVNEDKIHRSLR